MNYKHCCVVDAAGAYKTLVLVLLEPDHEGIPHEAIQCYTLAEGEQLIDAKPPATRIHANTAGFVTPCWDFETEAWTEAATADEIAAWEVEHPAPPSSPPSPTEVLQQENKLLQAQLNAQTGRSDFIEDCMAEMAAQVYST